MSDQAIRVRAILHSNGLKITDTQLDLLQKYYDLLLESNTRVNLISRRDIENAWFSHILHSISPLLLTSIPLGSNVLDLGSGGGLPGIPISIVRADLRLVHLDSIRKKVTAIQDMLRELSLSKSTAICSRAEDLATGVEARTFDVVLARAVAPLEDLIKWSKPLVRHSPTPRVERPSGDPRDGPRSFSLPFLLALKGGDLTDETKRAATKTGERRIHVLDISFKGSEELGLEEKKAVIVEL